MKSRDVELVLLESDILRENFSPLSLTRPTFDFLLGTDSLFHRIERSFGTRVSHVIVPKYLEATTRKNHPEIKVNEGSARKALILNPLISSHTDFQKEAEIALNAPSETLIVDEDSMIPAIAVLDGFEHASLQQLMSTGSIKKRPLKRRPLTSALIKYPWELFEQNSTAITADFNGAGHKSNATRMCEVLGNRLMVPDGVEISRNVTIDSRGGPVILSSGVEIQSFSLIQGPAFIGENTIVKSARVREGTSVGQDCRISGEIEKSIMFDYSNKNHEGFIGHSIIGSWANLGALTTNSDLKNTYGEIKMEIGGRPIGTGSNKVGIILGDMVKTAIGAIIYSGKKIGVSSHVFGTVIEDVPSYTLYGKSIGAESAEIYFDSAIETQKRMMERRGTTLSTDYKALLKSVFNITAPVRRKNKVRRKLFEIGN